jgi:signal transduction histidine kinase
LDRGNGNRMKDEDLMAATKKASLSRLINVVFPAFPILYLVGYFGKLNRDELYVGFVLLSVLAKLLFVSALIDEQITVTEEIKMRNEAEIMVNETRRSFLRYVFHELRIPLNTITMGMAVIEKNRGEREGQYIRSGDGGRRCICCIL